MTPRPGFYSEFARALAARRERDAILADLRLVGGWGLEDGRRGWPLEEGVAWHQAESPLLASAYEAGWRIGRDRALRGRGDRAAVQGR